MVELSGTALHIHGFCLDTIREISASIDTRANTHVLRGWRPASLDGEAANDAVLRSMVADIAYTVADEPYRGNKADWDVFLASSDLLTPEESMKADRIGVALQGALFGRRLCCTEHGRVGLVPAAAQLGDQIAVFFDGQVLYVVRPVAAEKTICEYHQRLMQTFEFVGECYIDGMMDGEAVSEDDPRSCLRLV